MSLFRQFSQQRADTMATLFAALFGSSSRTKPSADKSSGVHLAFTDIDFAEIWHQTKLRAALAMWVAGLFGNVLVFLLALVWAPSYLSTAIIATQAILLLLPMGKAPRWGYKLVQLSILSAIDFFPVTFKIEDPEALQAKRGRPYVIGFEPHSALPFAMPLVFSEVSGLMPPALQGIKCLASSAIFFVPGVRHFWWWLGMRSASRQVMTSILTSGGSVALCPGGVQECLHMTHGGETVFLRKRHGFVRLALQHGAGLMPAFAFGQTDMYSWYKPGPPLFPAFLIAGLSRMIGFLPLLMVGVYCTPIPKQVPVMVVLGKVIDLPKIENPSREQVEQYLQEFIAAMEKLVEKHKDEAGYPNMPLTVY